MSKNSRVLEEIEGYLENAIRYLKDIEDSVEEDTLSENDYEIVFSVQESLYEVLDSVQEDIRKIENDEK